MSQFAAGCAICGADLVAARAARGDTLRDRLERFEPGFLRDAERRKELVLVAIMALVVLAFPIFGLVLCGYIAYARHHDGDELIRNIAIALAVFSLLEMGVFEYQYGILWEWLG